MKLIPFEKSPDIICMLALKSSILGVHQKGLVQPSREDMQTTKDYQLFGLQDQNGVTVGVIDFSINNKHGTARAALFLENKELALKSVVVAAKNLCRAAGLAKLSLSVLCGEEGVADTMRESGYLPEVKYRAHMFIGGSLFSVTEYGCEL